MTQTVVSMLFEQSAKRPDAIATRAKQGDTWIARTYKQWEETSLAMAVGLAKLGVKATDHVGLWSHTRREWAEIDWAIMMLGAATVPVYQQTTAKHANDILVDSQCKVVVVEDPVQLEKLFDPACEAAQQQITAIVCIDSVRKFERPDAKHRLSIRIEDVVPPEHLAKVHTLAVVIESGITAGEDTLAQTRARASELSENVVATVVYTSGTTGQPRGVVLSHKNFVFECSTVGNELGITQHDEQLLMLPLAHIFAKLLLVSAVKVGCVTAFSSDLLSVMDDFKEINPTFFGGVPRFFSKVKSDTERRITLESPLRRKAASAAMDVARKVSAMRLRGEEPGPLLMAQYQAAKLAVLERVKALFGKRLRFALSGGAPLGKDLAEWFHACRILVLEGYGLTETTGATHANRPERFRLGTVGLPIKGVETKLAQDGEILVRGGNVMQGFLHGNNQQEPSIDQDGWLHTGDIGTIDKDGFLSIVDRRKDMIVTSSGKNIAPQYIEALLKNHSIITDVCVVGDDRPYLVALVVVNETLVSEWSQTQKNSSDNDEPGQQNDIQRALNEAVESVNQQLESFQHIRRFAVVPNAFSVEQDELTPSMKIRRKIIAAKYANLINSLYPPIPS